MAEGRRKVIVKAILTVELLDGIAMEELTMALQAAIEQVGTDYGDDVSVVID